MEKIARLKYYEKEDEFRIEIWDEQYQEWCIDFGCKCQGDLIHFSMLKELVRLFELGYEIHQAKGGK